MHDLIIEFYSEEIPAGVQEWAASNIDKKIKVYYNNKVKEFYN